MTSTSYVSEELALIWSLLVTTVVATFFIQRYKITYIPPSAAAMTLGMVYGGIAKLAGLTATLRFSPAAFFYGLLPPIVFAAGFTLKKREFFRNFGTITLFAVVGTLISTILFGLVTYLLMLMHVVKRSHLGTAPLVECMLYGALISATDPVATLSVFAELDVPPLLYNIVFGESVLNDAVAIVLFRTLEEFYDAPLKLTTLPLIIWRFGTIGIGSLLVGILVALPCAFLLKRFQVAPGEQEGRQHNLAFSGTVYEIALVVMSAYMAYLVAEVLQLSGIVALFFSGVFHAHYSYYSVAPDAQITLRRFFQFAAFLSETFVFAYLGLQVATLGSMTWDWGLLLTGLPLCLATRAANIFPLSRLANMRRKLPLPINLQWMVWAVGLRGAVAYGLALNLPQIEGESDEGIPAIESATLVIVVASTLFLGAATGPLLRVFDLQGVGDAEVAAAGYAQLHEGVSPTTAMARVRDISSGGSHTLLQRWKILDRHFLKPLFGGRQFSAAAVRGYPLVAPDGGIEEEDDEDDSETPRPGGTPTWAGKGKETRSNSLETGEYHPFLPGLAGGVSFGHNGLNARPGTELTQQHSGSRPESQIYRPPQPDPLDETRPDR
ncbi:hypothetical protein WJX75_001018 [Coccomyxa subellipsoidea]|uniref:Sodium/hydrogen exchanger n=1 Tax=Coccomyxa subellipsoidea TaxID=248742 RepID=A0ABR2YV71_9CHLO